MADESNIMTSTVAPPGADPPIHQAVVDLCIARRTLLIYPASHEQVKRSVQRAFQSLSGILKPESGLLLTLMKEGLAANGRIMDVKNTAFTDLATAFRQYQIAALTISDGLEYKEFVRFLRLMTAERDKIVAQGGIAAVAGRSRLDHLTFRTVDYSKLQTTEESEIHRSTRREGQGSLWQVFISGLLPEQGPMPAEEKTTAVSAMTPDALAGLLNRGTLRSETALVCYERAMADAAAHQNASSAPTGQGLQLFRQMIKALNPELQQQFLASTFDRWTMSPDLADTHRLSDGLGADLMVRMLEQAGSDGKQISPSLVAFINNIGLLDNSGEAAGAGDGHEADAAEGLTQSKIESLLAHEEYDTYVDADYSSLLNDLALQDPAAERKNNNAGGVDGLTADLNPAGICVHTARAMVRMMTASEDAAGYRDLGRQVAYLLDDLLEARAFDYLSELMGIVRSEADGRDPQRSEVAGLLLKRFSDTQFVANAIQAVGAAGKEPSPEALRLLMRIGEPVVLEIFDSVEPARILDEDESFIQILKSLPSQATREALERINDPRSDYVLQMIRVVRTLGDGESVQPIRSVLDHNDPEVRMEALAALLKFSNKWGLVRLRELLEQPAAPEFSSALDLAGAYRVRDVVPQLLSHLNQRGCSLELRETILLALGRIGDSRAIPDLLRLARRRWSISKKQIDRLKQVVYKSLKGYPFADIKHLLHLGLRQKDETIQAVCRQLLREGTRERVPNT
jgi:hypothetical protein